MEDPIFGPFEPPLHHMIDTWLFCIEGRSLLNLSAYEELPALVPMRNFPRLFTSFFFLSPRRTVLMCLHFARLSFILSVILATYLTTSTSSTKCSTQSGSLKQKAANSATTSSGRRTRSSQYEIRSRVELHQPMTIFFSSFGAFLRMSQFLDGGAQNRDVRGVASILIVDIGFTATCEDII
ncbi:hypothetical protein EV424DRAFT_1548596 [Suillus variegatus]|nr:hypothetical protein EV424DRAFT_1548596 [Suillus variegatus]